ncbi:MAG: hypothetical protein ACXAC5_00910 [Promethearchaeota archaeon]|jgi:hypothetical protein
MIRIGIVVCSWNEPKNIPRYLSLVLENWKNQRHPFHVDVLVSDNVSSPRFINQLAGWCKNNSSNHTTFSFISESTPRVLFDTVNLGFFTLKNSGEYDFLAYNADDIWFSEPDALAKVIKEFEQPDIGVVSPHVGWDNSLACLPHLFDEAGGTVVVKVGEHINMHFVVFSRYFMQKFNYRYVDVLGGYGTESFTSFQCASIGKKWLLHRGAKITNGRNPSIPKFKRRRRGNNGFFVQDKSKSLEEVIRPGYEVGLGYQVWNTVIGCEETSRAIGRIPGNFWMDYNKSLYTESGEIKDPEPLYRYLIENMYLPDVDYQSRFDAATKHLGIDK